jgi:cardiolipin synthase
MERSTDLPDARPAAMTALRHIPNALSVFRMLLVVPVALLLRQEKFQLTLAVFAFAAATDGLDGFLAKRCGWASELGKILDPLADKILLVGVFITLAMMDLVPIWLAATAVARDVVITAGALTYQCLYGYPHGKPTPVSKLNTLCQISYLLLIVAASAIGTALPTATTVLGALVFVTTVVSGMDYVITYTQKAIAASRADRRQS